MKRFFLNGIRPPKINLFGKKKEKKKKKNPIIIYNSFEKNKRNMIFSFKTLLTSIQK
jgi:hypothetical protein